MYDQGVPPERIADVVGHESTRMTSGVYKHLLDNVVDDAAEPLERALFGT